MSTNDSMGINHNNNRNLEENILIPRSSRGKYLAFTVTCRSLGGLGGLAAIVGSIAVLIIGLMTLNNGHFIRLLDMTNLKMFGICATIPLGLGILGGSYLVHQKVSEKFFKDQPPLSVCAWLDRT